jgi:hypothetical protein
MAATVRCSFCGESQEDVADFARATCWCDFADEWPESIPDFADRYDDAMCERFEADCNR